MKGYLNEPEKTKDTMDAEGFLKTGDIAVITEAGFVTIVDRVKELIKYKGFQVAPAELEALLITHPKIRDAIVIPCPDAEAGEIPRAYVVLKDDELEEADALVQWAASRTAPYKKLRGGVVFVKALPKTASGKLLRKDVVAMDRKSRHEPQPHTNLRAGHGHGAR